MRSFFSLLLATLILACPAMCRATEVACCPGNQTEECGDEPCRDLPVPVDEVDGCICGGVALKADESAAKHVLPLLATPSPANFETSFRLLLEALSRARARVEPDDGPRPVRLHVLLEVHRC